jgi:serpin B
MNKTASFDYLEDKDLQAIRLPYGKGNMAMYIFLPTDLDVFHERLTQEQWAEWRLGFESARGELSLPKFKFEYEQSLNEALTALGMGIAFDDIKADFSKMVEWGEDVFISEVKHKAFIEVDELGTEAAAVTSIEVQLTGRPPAPSFTMKVDRPFFFMIHDQQTDAVLFMGSVYDPS